MTERRPGGDHRDETGITVIKFAAAEPAASGGSDFPVIWSADRRGEPGQKTEYSLVQVPVDEPVEIRYSKPTHELDFTMSPTGQGMWGLVGDIDSDIVQLAGMPVASPRNRDTAPVIGEANLVALRAFGDVDASDTQILAVSLTLPVGHVEQLLDGLWKPKIARVVGRRMFSLEDNGVGQRTLPLKRSGTRDRFPSSLEVRRPAPKAPAKA